MISKKILKQLFVFVGLGIVGVVLMGCSSQAPLGGTAATTLEGSEPAVEGRQPVRQGNILEDPLLPVSVGAGIDNDARFRMQWDSENEGGLTGGWKRQALVNSANDSTGLGILAVGSGRATSAPDLALLRLGVESLASTVGEARTTAAEAMTAVVASVKEDGVEEKDIQTGYFSIQPRYTGREVTRCIEVVTSDDATEQDTTEQGTTEQGAAGQEGTSQEGTKQEGALTPAEDQECFQEYQSVITGYQVSNNVTVIIRDLETIDDAIDGAVEAGGDNIRFNGLSFSLEDTSTLKDDARTAAVTDLKGRAEHLATLSGVGLGDLVYIAEVGRIDPPVVRAEFALSKAAADFGGGVSTPISPGEVSIEVSVQGQYLITYPDGDESTEESATP